MSFLSSLLFWILMMTGNIELCDVEAQSECAQNDESCCQGDQEALNRVLWTTKNRPTNEISNGF